MIGKRFGKLVVIEKAEKKQHYVCKCDCGNTSVVFRGNLTRGNSRSCGCVRLTANGLSELHRAEYYCWSGIIKRCTNPSDKSFKNYGARGISVCEEWRTSFEQFLTDMGPRPSPEHSIDRVNNDGNYEPANCRWANTYEQANNTRKNTFFTYDGERLTFSQLADKYHIPRTTLINRVHKLGWSIEDAIDRPHFAGLYEYNGKMLKLPEIANLSGIKYATLYYRLNVAKLPIDDAIKPIVL